MVKAYSEDLRERVVRRVVSGKPIREVAAVFGVSVASVAKWSLRLRATGSVAANPMGGDRRSKLPPHREWLLQVIAVETDLTLEALAARLLAERGVRADAPMLCRFFKAAGISFKKKLVRRRAGTP